MFPFSEGGLSKTNLCMCLCCISFRYDLPQYGSRRKLISQAGTYDEYGEVIVEDDGSYYYSPHESEGEVSDFLSSYIFYKWQICIFIQTNLCTQNNRCLDCTRFPDRLKSWACPRVRLLKDHLNGLEEIRFPDRSRPVLIQPGMLGFSATQILWSVSIWWNSTNCLLQARPLDHHCLSVHHGGGLGYSRWRSRHKV